MKILVTCFDPFGKDITNSSLLVLENLFDECDGIKIIKQVLPTVRNKSFEVIERILLEEKDIIAVISLGQAGGRNKISLERVAINIDDFRIEDNEHNQVKDETIIEDGMNAYFSSLPIRQIEKELSENDIEVEISNSAGTFVCNHVFYKLMNICEEKYPDIKAGFIHIPYLYEQDSKGTMTLLKATKAIELAIETVIKERIGL